MLLLPVILTLLCLLAVAGLVYAEYHTAGRLRVICKVIASSAFVLLAIVLDATASHYGQLVLLALILSWIGDVFLLSARSLHFLAGLGAFLLAHVVFSVAFGTAAMNSTALWVAGAAMLMVGAVTLRWLWPRLDKPYRIAVPAYVLAIVAMCTLAIAHSAATVSWWVALGAVLFAASDILVARERFVASAFINPAWGLPLYFVAQLILAWSVV